MAEQFKNKIERLELENFTCFGKVGMDFSPGINVFIGENGTGKTHLLKVLYTITSANRNRVETHMSDAFRLNNFTNLIRGDAENASIRGIFGDGKYRNYELRNEDGNLGGGHYMPFEKPIKRLYIPPREMLSWVVIPLDLKGQNKYFIDITYYDLSDKLLIDPKEENLKEAKELLKNYYSCFAYEVEKGEPPYITYFIYTKDEPTRIDARVNAEGINKIAQFNWLIKNGSLNKDTILFWDEPEASLNPKHIINVAKFLQILANAGVQVFVSTHDYLLPYELSLSKEYAEAAEGEVPDMKFFSLYKGENGTEVEEGETMPDLNNDSIHEGLSIHQNREDHLFQKSVNN